MFYFLILSVQLICTSSFNVPLSRNRPSFLLKSAPADVETVAQSVTGEELEMMLVNDFGSPMIIDAYATWCGPCLYMAPEFELAAKELKGKVKFVKIADRLDIKGLPTLLLLDKYKGELNKDGSGPNVVLKERVEGGLKKDSIVSLCNYHFFGGPMPENLY